MASRKQIKPDLSISEQIQISTNHEKEYTPLITQNLNRSKPASSVILKILFC